MMPKGLQIEPMADAAGIPPRSLQEWLELGFHHRDWFLSDADLANVREHPRFQALIEQTTPPA